MDFLRWLKIEWDRAAAVAAVLGGLGAILLGWLGLSGEDLPAAQIPYLASGAVLGLFLLGIAATLWLSADLQDEWRKLDEINRRLAAGEPAPLTEANGASAAGDGGGGRSQQSSRPARRAVRP